MKKLIWIFLLLLIPIIAKSQTSNKYYHKSAVTAGDTLYTKGTASVRGGWLSRIVFGSCTASDTTIIKNGVGVVDTIVFGATAPNPFFLEYNCRLDTSLILVKKKTSRVTVIYGITY
jgi:hypothetical protein